MCVCVRCVRCVVRARLDNHSTKNDALMIFYYAELIPKRRSDARACKRDQREQWHAQRACRQFLPAIDDNDEEVNKGKTHNDDNEIVIIARRNNTTRLIELTFL